MKKFKFTFIFSLFLTLIFTLSSCNKIGNPTINYVDENGNNVSETIYVSKDKEYLKKVLNILNSIKPQVDKYQISSNIAVALKCDLYVEGKEKANIEFSYSSIDSIIYDKKESILYNRLQTTNLIKNLTDENLSLKVLESSTEYIYQDITYSNNNGQMYLTNTNRLDINIIERLGISSLESLSENYISLYDLYLYDCNKENIIFSLDYSKYRGLTGTDKAFIYVSTETGLISKVELYYKEFPSTMLKDLYKNKMMIYENVSNLISKIEFDYYYQSLPETVLSETQKAEYKSTSSN
jgi:hypothetical protein